MSTGYLEGNPHSFKIRGVDPEQFNPDPDPGNHANSDPIPDPDPGESCN